MWKLSAAIYCACCGFLSAHEDPHDVIHALTHQLEHAKEAEKTKIYFRRASEYRVSGQKEKAREDLLIYTKLKPADYLGWLELGRIEQTDGDQLRYFIKALGLAANDEQKVAVYNALAEHFYAKQLYDKALKYCEKTLELDELRQLTPILLKSHLLWQLGQLDKRVEFLSLAKKSNPSVVIEHAWIDAAIEAGQGAKMELRISKELEAARFKSSWLLRAARCKPKHSPAAKLNAQLAIREIKKRLNDKRPDVTLLMDLSCAYLICDEYAKAEQYLKRAKSLPFDPWAMAELSKRLEHVRSE